MAKKIYHIPLQETHKLIAKHKSEFNKLSSNKKYLEYQKLIGKALYTLEIKEFLEFFKIDKDLTYSLKVIEYFNSSIFFKELCKHLNFAMLPTKIVPKILGMDFLHSFMI